MPRFSRPPPLTLAQFIFPNRAEWLHRRGSLAEISPIRPHILLPQLPIRLAWSLIEVAANGSRERLLSLGCWHCRSIKTIGLVVQDKRRQGGYRRDKNTAADTMAALGQAVTPRIVKHCACVTFRLKKLIWMDTQSLKRSYQHKNSEKIPCIRWIPPKNKLDHTLGLTNRMQLKISSLHCVIEVWCRALSWSQHASSPSLFGLSCTLPPLCCFSAVPSGRAVRESAIFVQISKWLHANKDCVTKSQRSLSLLLLFCWFHQFSAVSPASSFLLPQTSRGSKNTS